MFSAPPITLNLYALNEGIPVLTVNYCRARIEAARYCFWRSLNGLKSAGSEANLASNSLPTEVAIGIWLEHGKEKTNHTCHVSWKPPTDSELQVLHSTYGDATATTEDGAVAVALLLALAVTEYDRFEVSRKKK